MRLGDYLLVTSSHLREVERERKQQEDKVTEITQQLKVKRVRLDQQKVKLRWYFEIFFIKYFLKAVVRRLWDEEDMLDREHCQKMDEAERFEREARELEAEAARLEWESR